MRIAAVQLACILGDVQANLNKIRDFCRRAKQEVVDLIVFPEAADTGYSMPVIRQHARPLTEGAVPALQDMAKEFALTIVSGVAERERDSIYNAQVFIDPTGEIVASYRKTHLFVLPPNDESTCYTPGDKFVSVPAAGFRFGLSICYDIRFPEVCRTLALSTPQMSCLFPLPGRFRALRIYARWLWRAPSKTRVIWSSRIAPGWMLE